MVSLRLLAALFTMQAETGMPLTELRAAIQRNIEPLL